MIEVINSSHDPYFNLALEEFAVKNWSDGQSYFILWQNQPAVIVGRNQNTIGEINQAYIEEQGIKVVRRMSGGGAVYHDLGNLNFTIVVNENNDFANFEKFTRPVIAALEKIGIEAENNGRNDITIEGRKFSGNAQFKFKDRLLHHGTILFDSRLEDMARALNPGEQKISSKGIKSVRSRVTNISEHLSAPVSVEEFKRILAEEVLQGENDNHTYHLSDADLQAVNYLKNNKYAAWAWNYGNSPAYNIRKTGVFSWGNIDIRLDIKRGLISGCRIYGDYFAAGDIGELEQALIGEEYREEEIKKCLAQLQLKKYLPQTDETAFTALLCK
ncbi:lipoate-protein ligase a [hydrocarbon metagenome]|uniref:lipoate--protein ligase n=1 Tax=hydrocarbon metagenome TaxID=938273 RepID=A0A0W8E1D0_9ZZZZ